MTNARILVVEDEGVIAADIEDILIRQGYEVVAVVSTGEDAIQKATELRPDIVLMDIKLSGAMSGTTAAQQINTELDIPIVYLTAHSDDTTLADAKLAESHGIIIKPFKDAELRANIEIGLHAHHAEQRRLSDLRQRFESTLNSIKEAVIALDKYGRITFINSNAEQLTDCMQDKWLGKALTTALTIGTKARGALDEAIADALSGRIATALDTQIEITRRNEVNSLAASIAPIKDVLGNRLGVVLILCDVTQLQRIQSEREALIHDLQHLPVMM